MRKRRTTAGLTVNAIAGTHVVLLGLDLSDAARKKCVGFAIRREDHTEGELTWMRGSKTFEATDPGLGPGGQASSREHPFQSFQWADYSAHPDYDYTYRVTALLGTATKLVEGATASVRVQTEAEYGSKHSVFFNRGSLATQEYARRFQDRPPSKLPPVEADAARRWLSRGLHEAVDAFIGRAKNGDYGLFGAIYEFRWPAVLDSIAAAKERGADVRILFDAIKSETRDANEAAINASTIPAGVCTPRTRGTIMHNKFFVLTKKGKPVAVWTGSTNLSENGIFGQSNVGHLVEDAKVARAYLDYFNEMSGDPVAGDERAWVDAHNPRPPSLWSQDLTEVFSPHTGTAVLDWYAQIAAGAQKGLFMTFPFGMDERFLSVYDNGDDVLRFALMEKEGNGAGLAQGRIDVRRIRRLPNVIVALGNRIVTNSFDRWLKEADGIGRNVDWVHTKYMIVDPLGSTPIVVTGSANFSEASTNKNNENMLVIRGDTRVADIYLGEFMRLYSHYAFREAVKIAKENGESDWRPQFLIPSAAWQDDYYRVGSQRFRRRQYFAGGT